MRLEDIYTARMNFEVTTVPVSYVVVYTIKIGDSYIDGIGPVEWNGADEMWDLIIKDVYNDDNKVRVVSSKMKHTSFKIGGASIPSNLIDSFGIELPLRDGDADGYAGSSDFAHKLDEMVLTARKFFKEDGNLLHYFDEEDRIVKTFAKDFVPLGIHEGTDIAKEFGEDTPVDSLTAITIMF